MSGRRSESLGSRNGWASKTASRTRIPSPPPTVAMHPPSKRDSNMPEQPSVPILDVRDARAFRRGHWRDAVHLREDRLLAEPYLLPPRHRRFLVVGRDEAHASA